MRTGSAAPAQAQRSTPWGRGYRLVDIVEGLAGLRLRRRYDLSAPQGVRGRNSDNTLIRAVLGWAPSIGLEDGLECTYRSIYDEVRARMAA